MYYTKGPAQYIQFAIESTLFLTPFDEGLTYQEIKEILSRFNFQKGEIDDAFNEMRRIDYITQNWGEERLKLKEDYIYYSMIWDRFRPDPISESLKYSLFNYLLNDLKSYGSSNYHHDINVLVNKLEESQNLDRLQLLSFIRSMQLAKWIELSKDNKSIIKIRKEALANSTESFKRMDNRNGSEVFHTLLPVVKDVIGRRNSIVPISSDPFDGFHEQLKILKADKYKLWWTQTISEISLLDVKRNPTAKLILSASICEGILAFIIEYSKDMPFAMIKNIRIEEPRTWKLTEMIRATASGPIPLMKEDLRKRLENMNENRKRIHPAAYLPSGSIVPDLKPEQSQEAFETAQMLSRYAIDWIVLNLKS